MARKSLGYMPALDGVRAVALLAILCYHAGYEWMSGGFLTIDAFFVLSGFLITALLLEEWSGSQGIAFKKFWLRRARRLLPALFLVLLAASLYAATMAASTELRTIREDTFSTLFYFANWQQIATGASYFHQFSLPSPLQHTWSLAIEEQFYLFWPLIVFALLKWGRGRRKDPDREPPTDGVGSIRPLVIFAVVGIALSATLMAVLYDSDDPSRVHFGTDTRAQSVLVGALLAMLWFRRPVISSQALRKAVDIGGIAAVVALGYIWSTQAITSTWIFYGGLLFSTVLVAFIILGAVQPNPGPIGRILSIAPLRGIGMISYGLYLWHWPVFIVLSPSRIDLDRTPLFALRLVATFGLAIASFYLVERPIRFGGLRGWRVRFATPFAVASIVAACLVVTAGAPTTQAEVTAADVTAPKREPVEAGEVRPLSVMLVGDSVMDSLAPGLASRAEENNFELWNAAVHGCGLANDISERSAGIWWPPDPRCTPSWRERWPKGVEEWDPDVVVALLGQVDSYDYRNHGTVYRFDEPSGEQFARSHLEQAVDVLTRKGAHLVLLTSPYYEPPYFSNSPEHGIVFADSKRAPVNPEWIDRWNTLQREVAAANPGKVTVLDLNRVLDPEGRWTPQINGVTVRAEDRVHLSPDGADLAGRWLVPELLKLVQRPGESRPPVAAKGT